MEHLSTFSLMMLGGSAGFIGNALYMIVRSKKALTVGECFGLAAFYLLIAVIVR
jgi:hypothetical protein